MSILSLLGVDEGSAFLRDLLMKIGEATPDLIYAKDLNSRMLFANQAVLDVVGKSWDDIRGRSDVEWHHDPEEARRFVEADARIMASGVTERLEEVLTGLGPQQTYLSTKGPLRADDGRIIGMFGISMNITERKNAERLRQLLMDELDHRVKNTLTVVRVMARQTLKSAEIERKVWDAFEGRLQSMAQAHNVLTRESWEGANIRQVVSEALQSLGDHHAGHFDIAGPEVWTDAQNALSLAMALHELSTNAIKYGALSVPGGRVAITWTHDRTARPAVFDLRWTENGGPTVTPPEHQGFGSRLIAQAFGQQGNDIAKVDYAPTGVQFHVRFALRERVAPGE